jgi:ribosomal protein S18 acetylase RimI-like enzyme
MMPDINYTINQSNAGEILIHLEACDKTFSPPLSQRLDLSAYAEKLLKFAVNFEAWNRQSKLIGLISVYMNDVNLNAAFITNVSVCPEYTGKGIAKKIMTECIQKTKEKGFAQIHLEVNALSASAIKLYSVFGFEIVEINKEMIKMNLKLKSNDKY